MSQPLASFFWESLTKIYITAGRVPGMSDPSGPLVAYESFIGIGLRQRHRPDAEVR